jgi:hypothetical protein
MKTFIRESYALMFWPVVNAVVSSVFQSFIGLTAVDVVIFFVVGLIITITCKAMTGEYLQEYCSHGHKKA